jgi:hypothetical protein
MASAFPAPTGKDDRPDIYQIQIIKMVVATLVNEDGEKIYPRTWNQESISLPELKNQWQSVQKNNWQLARGLPQIDFTMPWVRASNRVLALENRSLGLYSIRT